jgi:hypothetical protein
MVRAPMLRRVLLLGAALSSLALLSCKGQCRQLSEKLCQCQATTFAKEQCMQRAAAEESRVHPTAAQEATCQSLLANCDCHQIDTPAGKRACGLANP